MEELAIRLALLVVLVGIGLAIDKWYFDELMRAGWDKPAKYVPLHEQLIALLTDNQEGASK